MKRMVELPSGEWLDIDMIESFAPQTNGYVLIRMQSGYEHFIGSTTPSEVIYNIKKVWQAWVQE